MFVDLQFPHSAGNSLAQKLSSVIACFSSVAVLVTVIPDGSLIDTAMVFWFLGFWVYRMMLQSLS